MSIFSKIQVPRHSTNRFNLSHDRKYSMRMGELIPSLVIETLPADKFDLQSSHMIRFAPMIAPIMHQVNVFQHFFFVPNRILWDNWEDFITGGKDGTSAPPPPTVQVAAVPGTLADYLGVSSAYTPGPIQPTFEVSALPFAAYQRVFQDYYKDENLDQEWEVKLEDGDNADPRLGQIRTRAWMKDYFTSALPFTQRGPEVTIPLGDSAPIVKVGTGNDLLLNPNFPQAFSRTLDANTGTQISGAVTASGGGFTIDPSVSPDPPDPRQVVVNNAGSLRLNTPEFEADLSQATSNSVNDLRRAIALQNWLEASARAGYRYVEQLLIHWNLKVQDSRLQRAEYLGGYKVPVQISEVLQTSSTGDYAATPQGNMAGHGINAGSSGKISFLAPEHGYIIGIMSIMPKPSYMQGIPKHFLRKDRFDYGWAMLAHLGEQPILNKELYADGTPDDDGVFGYTPRYAEYKYMPDTVHGEFRTSLEFWHLARKFANRPQLNSEFVRGLPDYDRIFAVEDAEQLYCHLYNDVRVSRKLPYFGTPKIEV